MTVKKMAPDERALRSHLEHPAFLEGVARGRWRVADQINWPYVLIAVSAAPRENGPSEFFFRFDLDGYPASAPTINLWDPEKGDKLGLEKRPKGEVVAHVFRTDWEEGRAVYAPFDRIALKGHAKWPRKHPGQAWDPSKDLAWVIRQLHRWLNDDLYLGV